MFLLQMTTDRNVGNPKTSTERNAKQNVDKPKCRQTKHSRNQKRPQTAH